jgi:putative hemolysin
MEAALWWLFFNLLSIVIQAFYSMMEMACVSFNKVRLHYYVHQGNKHAEQLNYLLQHPFRLFGTTLIGVNIALVAGSECAREFHTAIGINPDFAPISQVFLVVIFGELAPMFAARHYAEHVAMLGAPIVYATARMLTPALWIIGWVTRITNYFFRGKVEKINIFLNQEELQKILEEHSDEPSFREASSINLISQNIFRLRHKTARDIMVPLHAFPSIPSNATIAQLKQLIKKTDADFALIYYKEYKHIVSIVFPRDLLRVQDSKRARDHAKQPWFVTDTTPLTKILQQFQRNNQSVALILDKDGQAIGVITLNDLLSEIFGDVRTLTGKEKGPFIVERTFSGDTTVKEFNLQFDVKIDEDESLTLSELMENTLGHLPEKGESIFIPPFEIFAKETSLLEVKFVTVRTRQS